MLPVDSGLPATIIILFNIQQGNESKNQNQTPILRPQFS